MTVSVIVDSVMGQIPRSTERISSFDIKNTIILCLYIADIANTEY